MLTQAAFKSRVNYDPATGEFTWRATTAYQQRRVGQVAGWLDNLGYRNIEIDGKRYKAARLAFLFMIGRWPNNEADHINRNPSDDRWVNLREATRSTNNVNRVRKRISDLPRGVNYNKSGYHACCGKDGIVHYLGTFATAEEASAAYQREATKLHGEFLPGAVSA